MSSQSDVCKTPSSSNQCRKSEQHVYGHNNQLQLTQHARVKACEEEKREEETDLQAIIASASHSQLSQVLLDLCRHSKTAADFTKSHLLQSEVPVAVASPASSYTNKATKKPKVLRSILKKRYYDTVSCPSSGEVSWSPSCPDEASPSLGRVSLQLPSSVAFSFETNAGNSNSNSKSKSSNSKSSKSKPSSNISSKDNSPAFDPDSHPSKKRKSPTSIPTTRCRNCGSEYTTTSTPNSSPSGEESSSTKPTIRVKRKEEICIHHPGEREVQPSHPVWEDFDPDLHGDAWTLIEYEAFACGFRWSCCKREVGEQGCVVAGRHEAAPVPLGMPLCKRARR